MLAYINTGTLLDISIDQNIFSIYPYVPYDAITFRAKTDRFNWLLVDTDMLQKQRERLLVHLIIILKVHASVFYCLFW